MNQQIIPEEFEEINESFYAGFWQRLGAMFIDVLILIPVGFGIQFLNGLNKDINFYTFLPSLLFFLFYQVYLVKRYGGTPGKLIVGIKIINKNGADANWRNATYRYIVDFIFALFTTTFTLFTLSKISAVDYESLGLLERTKYLSELNPSLFSIQVWLSNIWVWGEFIVLLTNKRKRAIHDFIADTVVIKAKYHAKIKSISEPQSAKDNFPTLQFLGIVIFFLFIFSILALLLTNEQALIELDNIGPTGYNILGFDLQRQVQIVNYILPGLLISIFGFLLSKRFSKSDASFYGSLILILAGLGWLSFGVIAIDPNGEETLFGTIHMIRILITWISMILSLILISVDFERYVNKIFRWLTFSVAILLIAETTYQLSLDSLYSGIVSTFGYSLFFVWFLAFALTKKKA